MIGLVLKQAGEEQLAVKQREDGKVVNKVQCKDISSHLVRNRQRSPISNIERGELLHNVPCGFIQLWHD